MSDQPMLFPIAGVPGRRRRRCLWRDEMVRMARYHADQRARDTARHEAALARVDRQIADLRDRLVDIERGLGAANLARAPVRRAELREFTR